MTSESDAEFVERIKREWDGDNVPCVEDFEQLIDLARRGAAMQMAQDDQFARIQKLEAEALVLRAAMMKVTEALNQGRIVSLGGVTGMTMDAMMRNSVYNRVPCGPIEDAIAMLDEADLRRVPPPPKGAENE